MKRLDAPKTHLAPPGCHASDSQSKCIKKTHRMVSQMIANQNAVKEVQKHYSYSKEVLLFSDGFTVIFLIFG